LKFAALVICLQEKSIVKSKEESKKEKGEKSKSRKELKEEKGEKEKSKSKSFMAWIKVKSRRKFTVNIPMNEIIAAAEKRENLSEDLSEEFKKNCKEKQKHDKDKAAEKGKSTQHSSSGDGDNKPRGFDRHLDPERINGATQDSGELLFLIKWIGSDETDIVLAKEANVRCPQTVIKYYEDRINWHDDDNHDDNDD